MRIAVTGASGFIGGVLARRLAGQGHTVFAFGRRPESLAPTCIPNYRQWELPADLSQAPEVDAVIHCAAKVGDWGDLGDYHRVNVEGTRAVLQAFVDTECFVHVSSASVYSSKQPENHLSEDSPVGGGLYTAYARSKFEAEQLILSSGRRVVILRPQIVYGPGDRTLLPRLLAARRFGWLPVPGDGCCRLSVTHVLNIAHAVDCVLDSPAVAGIFNIADKESPRVDDMLQVFLRQNGVLPRLIHVPRNVAWAAAVVSEWLWRAAGSRHAPRLTRYLVAHVADGLTLDLRRAFTTLGYAPRHTIHDNRLSEEFE